MIHVPERESRVGSLLKRRSKGKALAEKEHWLDEEKLEVPLLFVRGELEVERRCL